MISLLADSLIFDESIDGANEWHKTVLSNIGTQIQEKLHQHQFPGNCSEARFGRFSIMFQFSFLDSWCAIWEKYADLAVRFTTPFIVFPLQ